MAERPQRPAGRRGPERSPRSAEAAETRQPYRPARKPGPRRPELPEDRPFVPRDAWRDLRATAPQNVLDDVVKAVGGAAEALEAGEIERATQLLQWAKSVAPRTATIREALGIALYDGDNYAQAQAELLAYRRLSGSVDQNHLLADCARALGRPEKVEAYIDEMAAANVDPARMAEGLIVLAGERADRGDLEGALDALRRADLSPVEIQPWHPRMWYVAGDLSERMGRTAQAREFFSAIVALDADFGDAEERLMALG